MSFKSVVKNIWYRGFKDLRKDKVKTYLEYIDVKDNGVLIPFDQVLSFSEQIVYRSIQCGDCLAKGECKICHCDEPEHMTTPSARCEGGKWGPTQNKEDWNLEKELREIKIVLQ